MVKFNLELFKQGVPARARNGVIFYFVGVEQSIIFPILAKTATGCLNAFTSNGQILKNNKSDYDLIEMVEETPGMMFGLFNYSYDWYEWRDLVAVSDSIEKLKAECPHGLMDQKGHEKAQNKEIGHYTIEPVKVI